MVVCNSAATTLYHVTCHFFAWSNNDFIRSHLKYDMKGIIRKMCCSFTHRRRITNEPDCYSSFIIIIFLLLLLSIINLLFLWLTGFTNIYIYRNLKNVCVCVYVFDCHFATLLNQWTYAKNYLLRLLLLFLLYPLAQSCPYIWKRVLLNAITLAGLLNWRPAVRIRSVVAGSQAAGGEKYNQIRRRPWRCILESDFLRLTVG